MQQTQQTLADPRRTPAGGTPVLILDDERFDRHRLARLCSGLDFHCDITNATSLSDFGVALEAGYYELILLDYRLPDGTGLEALDMVRLSARNNCAATIMITGQAQDSVAQSALASGCRDYLSKDDLSASAFQRAVKSALDHASNPKGSGKGDAGSGAGDARLDQFAGQCVREMKPMVSRLMRQVRDLRGSALPEGSANRIDGIEESCITLWEFLVTLEKEGHQALTLEPQPLSAKMDTLEPRLPRKPPSPFSRFRN